MFIIFLFSPIPNREASPRKTKKNARFALPIVGTFLGFAGFAGFATVKSLLKFSPKFAALAAILIFACVTVM